MNLETGRIYSEPTPDCHKFDSKLEYEVYRFLIAKDLWVQPHFELELMPKCGAQPAINYTPDFYLPALQVAVEVKGDWIRSSRCKADRELFLIKWNLLCRRRIDGYVVNSSAFKIGKNFEVINYTDLPL